MNNKYMIIILMVFILTGCSTSYQKRNIYLVFTYGYTDEEIEPGKYSIKFRGQRGDELGMLRRYWHRRASELCPGGYSEASAPANDHALDINAYTGLNIIGIPYIEGIAECK
ncbi:MAG: hypothetical protein OEX03_00100 [Gammaproteobacteria bacterium]|nr:hypothetical protein [Gammaproteobacteria bacterium]